MSCKNVDAFIGVKFFDLALYLTQYKTVWIKKRLIVDLSSEQEVLSCVPHMEQEGAAIYYYNQTDFMSNMPDTKKLKEQYDQILFLFSNGRLPPKPLFDHLVFITDFEKDHFEQTLFLLEQTANYHQRAVILRDCCRKKWNEKQLKNSAMVSATIQKNIWALYWNQKEYYQRLSLMQQGFYSEMKVPCKLRPIMMKLQNFLFENQSIHKK